MSNRNCFRQYSCQCSRLILLVTLSLLFGQIGSVAAEQKGVFTGDHVGCKSKADLFAYYDAKEKGKRVAMSKMVSERKCLTLAGRTYVPLRIGFVTAHVRVTYQGSDIDLWARSVAVVESPPPPRETHFNF